MHVLIVDDDLSLRSCLALLASNIGFTVTEAGDALEAFDKIKTTEFDAVVTDVQMPGGGGVELLRTMRGHKHTPPTYIHSSESTFLQNGEPAKLAPWISNHFGEFASFKIKDGRTLKNVKEFLESILSN